MSRCRRSGTDLDFAEENLQWVITAYGLTYGGFLLLGGRAADLLGRRVVFMGGLALFGLASLVCGLSTSSGMLIAARGVQGLGAAIVTPAALSIISVTFTEGSRAQQGSRSLGRRRRGRRRGRRRDGRRPDEVSRLGVDLLGQRAGGGDRPHPHADLRAREPPRGRCPRLRPAGGDQRDRGPGRARLRDLGGPAAWAGGPSGRSA